MAVANMHAESLRGDDKDAARLVQFNEVLSQLDSAMEQKNLQFALLMGDLNTRTNSEGHRLLLTHCTDTHPDPDNVASTMWRDHTESKQYSDKRYYDRVLQVGTEQYQVHRWRTADLGSDHLGVIVDFEPTPAVEEKENAGNAAACEPTTRSVSKMVCSQCRCPVRVCIDGNIGAGKSTILRQLASEYPVREEPLDDWGDLLDAYYKDPKRHAYDLQ